MRRADPSSEDFHIHCVIRTTFIRAKRGYGFSNHGTAVVLERGVGAQPTDIVRRSRILNVLFEDALTTKGRPT